MTTHPRTTVIAKHSRQCDTKWETARTGPCVDILAPERERLSTNRRRHRPATRMLVHPEQALDLFDSNLILCFVWAFSLLCIKKEIKQRTTISKSIKSVALRQRGKNTHADGDISEVQRLEELDRSLDGPPRAKNWHGHCFVRLGRNLKAQAQASAPRLLDELCRSRSGQQRGCLCERMRMGLCEGRAGRPASVGEARFVEVGLGVVRGRLEGCDCVAREGDCGHRRRGVEGEREVFLEEGEEGFKLEARLPRY